MLKSVFLFVLCCGPVMAQDFSTQPNPPSSRWKKVWAVSLAALAAGNALDASTSYGKFEANPMLARNGRFGAASIGLKIGLQAPFVGYQVWQVRRDKGASARRWAIANFALAGAFSAVAIHNAGVPRPANLRMGAP